jgi:diguanylate cyclase (GGDEF)-like protein
MRTVESPIPSRKGVPLGTISAAFHPQSVSTAAEMEALGTAARLASLAIETSQLYSDLVHRSEFDALTNVQNRFSMENVLEAQIKKAHEAASIFGLLYLDLDNFKEVNDEHGHRVGDIYLQEVARRLIGHLRPGDVLARLGGDEFAAMTPRVHNRNDIIEIARRIERCFEEPFELEGLVLYGSASVGVAMYPNDGTTKDTLLTSADAAMYVAKQTRRLVHSRSLKDV